MPSSRRSRTPSYRLHRPSGQAVVTLNGKDHYLGKHGTPESHEAYDRLVAEWLAQGRRPTNSLVPDDGPTIAEVILAYWHHASNYYRKTTGEPTKELGNIRLVLRRLRRLYGTTSAASFDSLALEALRDGMIGDGLCRTRINKDIDRLKRMFKWAAAKRLVPVGVFQLLQTVTGLREGRTAAKERPPVKPVPDEQVDATLPYLTAQVATMVQLQRLTGMRPGEVTIMRGVDIDTSGDIWLYRPGSGEGRHGDHKTAWRGRDRVIAVGPKAEAILRPWLRKNPLAYLFQPREARIAFNAERRARRKSKVPPSQQKRTPKKNPKKKFRERYRDSSYAQAIAKGCIKAHCQTCTACHRQEGEKRRDWLKRVSGCPGLRAFAWHPNQLRHSHATEVRKRFGLEAAQVALGHAKANVTEIYAERNLALAVAVAMAMG